MRYRLRSAADGDDLGTIEHPPPKLQVGGFVELLDGRRAIVSQVFSDPSGPLAGVLEVEFETDQDDTSELVIDVSAAAWRRILDHGGRLYLWNEALGLATRDCLAYHPPGDVEFECDFIPPENLVQVCLPIDFPFLRVSIDAQRWPRRGLRVQVDGERWGWRGDESMHRQAGLPGS